MNETCILTAAAPEQARHWYRRKLFCLAGFLGAFAIWLVIPPTYSGDGIRFSLHHSGTPGVITFVVRDPDGAPMPDVTVMSESESGTTQEFTTDASGVATIRPGESEVLAVRIARREFRFRPRYRFLGLFAPDCSPAGLTLRISIRNERNPG